jgi:preprotein translocase subunit SecG
LLTKASWWCGGLFLGLSFLLALASTHNRAPKSVLDQTFQTPTSAPAPVTTPGAPTGSANPTVPLTPAPTTTAPATPAPTKPAPAPKKP